MKIQRVNGSTITTFDHVTRRASSEQLLKDNLTLILVWFDGEPELWYCLPGKTQEAIKELYQYYLRDWKGSDRMIPIQVFLRAENYVVNCL